MINPQLENGYTTIANEILEKMCSYRISGEEHLVLWSIIRKTYGFKKKEDHIALSQFQIMTGMKKPTIQRAISKLSAKKLIVIKKDNQIGNMYRFNKHFDEWSQLSKKITSPKGGIKKDNRGESLLRHTKETNTKERNTIVANATEVKDFNFNEELELLRNGGIGGKRKDFKIIALYWKKKKWVFGNKEQLNSALKRELRATGALKGYSGEEILRAISFCMDKYPEIWTLETVHRRITDLVNKK